MQRFSVADSLPLDLIHHILSFLTNPSDFASISLLNKHWYKADSTYRRSIKVFNCFAISPTRLTRRFQSLTSLTLVAKPNLDDDDDDKARGFKWRVEADQWIECVTRCYKGLRELRLKRFVLSDYSLLMISKAFIDLRLLVFVGCEEIPSYGLGSVVRACRFLEVLELRDCSGMSENETWLIHFPERCEFLRSLSFVNVKGGLDVAVLERVISGCCSLKCLKLDEQLQPEVMTRFLKSAPQLVELGFGTDVDFSPGEIRGDFVNAISNCVSVQSLSGAWNFRNPYLINSLCSQLLFLDLTRLVRLMPQGMADFIQQCHNLQRLWVRDSIRDHILKAVGKTCAKLQELKVIPSPTRGNRLYASARVTDAGLTFITFSCHKLQSVTYSSQCMSNDALVNLARLNPNIRKFKLTLLKSEAHGVEVSPSLDEGFGAILQSCKNLNQLVIRNAHVTDQVFFFAGLYGAELKRLYVKYGGNSKGGIFYALNLCLNLKQLVIRGPFGDADLLAAAEKLKNLQFVWVNSHEVTVKGAKTLREISSLSTDIMDCNGKAVGLALEMQVQNLLIYHRLREPRDGAYEP